MPLAVSSTAAPDLPLADLLEGCRRRGLAALELSIDPALPPPGPALEDVARRVGEMVSGGPIPLSAVAALTEPAEPETALALARALHVPALLPSPAAADPALRHRFTTHLDRGGRLLFLHASDPDGIAVLRTWIRDSLGEGAAIAWQVDPARDPAARIPAVLEAAGDALRYVRLRGGGPEAARQTGLGVGTLMGRLALARFAGPLVLTPSDARYHLAWRSWLTRAGGWGCGSKHSDAALVSLDRPASNLQERAS
jgi:hypothetical protein